MKTKEINPTRPGSPTPCRQALSVYCCKTGLKKGGETRNFAFQVVWQQCCTQLHIFVARFTEGKGVVVGKPDAFFASAFRISIHHYLGAGKRLTCTAKSQAFGHSSKDHFHLYKLPIEVILEFFKC